MNYTIRTAANYQRKKTDFEQNNGISRTKPDMTYTPAELLIRYRKGLPMDKLSTYSYHNDIAVPDPRTLDLTEMADAISHAKSDYAEKLSIYKEKEKQRSTQRKEALQRQIRELQSAMTQEAAIKLPHQP